MSKVIFGTLIALVAWTAMILALAGALMTKPFVKLWTKWYLKTSKNVDDYMDEMDDE